MKQKFQDFALLVKRERKYQVGLALAGLALVYLMVAPNAPRQSSGRSRLRNEAPPKKDMNLANAESYRDLTESLKVDMDKQDKKLQGVVETVKKIDERQTEYEKTTTEIFKKLIDKMNDMPTSGSAAPINEPGSEAALPEYDPNAVSAALYGEDQTNPNNNPSIQNVNLNTNPGELSAFGDTAAPPIAPPLPRTAKKIAVVTAGDSVRVKLLAGVNAPTDGTPYPVVFKLVGNVNGPDDSTLSLGEGRLIAAAQGSLTDQRALFRLTKLSIAYPNGRRREIEVDGWIVGEDGMRGMEGLLLDPIGKAIGATLLGGALQGTGEALASKNVTTSTSLYGGSSIVVSGDETEYVAGRALGKAADRWSQLVSNRVNQMVPHVQILSGREATAVFARSFKIPDLLDELQVEEESNSSLD